MKILRYLRSRFHHGKIDAEMADEMRHHVEEQVRRNVQSGMPLDEAVYAAQRQFGNLASVQERAREQRAGIWFEQFRRDALHAIRMLGRRPGFTAIAVLTLGLGIGANTAMFSVLRAVVLRPLPYDEPDRLVVLYENNPVRNAPRSQVSMGNHADWRARSQSFEDIAVTNQGSPITVIVDGVPERSTCQYATPELFPVLRLPPLRGRAFTTSELQRDARVVMISEGYWQRRFGAAPDMMGRTLAFNGEVHTIVGVLPRGRTLSNQVEPDIWRALKPATPGQAPRDTSRWLTAVARLKPGVTLEQAQAEMDAIAAQLAQEYPASNQNWGVRVVSLHTALYGAYGRLLVPLLGAVGFVLLIACVNLANLLLARAATRTREMAIRSALGAGRARLFRQLLAEAMALAVPGAALGLLFGAGSVRAMALFLPAWLPRRDEVALDGTVLLFTLVIAVGATIVAALAPAWQASGAEERLALRTSGAAVGTRRQRRLRDALVVAEVALALVLLAGAGLMLNSVVRLRQVEPGFSTEKLLAMEVSLGGRKYWSNAPGGLVRIEPATTDFFQEALARIEALPQVGSAGMISWLPMTPQRGRRFRSFSVAGGNPAAPGERREAGYNAVSPDYFRTMGIRLQRGRSVTARDTVDAPWVVVVSEGFAQKYWPGENPLGRQLTLDIMPGERPREVVGVVSDVRQVASHREPVPEIYVPVAQQPSLYPGDAYQGRIHMSVVVRTEAPAAAIVPLIRARLAELDPEQPVYGVQTVEQVVAESGSSRQFHSLLLGSFAALAALLAGLGIHGVMACAVAERRHEIGVRMALGAQPREVMAMIFRHVLVLVLCGTALGLAGAQAAARSIQAWLFGVTPHDPLTYALVCAGIAVLAMLAAIRPARQASMVDPVVALRAE